MIYLFTLYSLHIIAGTVYFEQKGTYGIYDEEKGSIVKSHKIFCFTSISSYVKL